MVPRVVEALSGLGCVVLLSFVSLTFCFQYMVILFIVFLFQFGISCSCLAMNRGQQVSTLTSLLDPETARCVTLAPPAGGPPELHVEDVGQQDQD